MIYIDREYLYKRSLFILLLIVIGWIFLFYSPPDIDKKLIEKNDSYFYGVCEEYSSFNPKKIVIHSVTDIDGDLICDKAIVYRDTKSDIDCVEPRIGNILKINGSSEVFCEPGNPGQFNELSYYTSLGFQAKIFASKISVVDDNKDVVADLMNEIRTGLVFILYKYLPEDVAGTVAAITVGEKSGLEERTKELYRQSGIAHILAISGLHISLVGYGLFMFLRRFLFHKKVAAFLSGGLVFFYGLMTGFSLSARRAVVMMIVLLISNIIEKKYDSLNSLALAALIELCLHPLSLYQSAFWFSYGTVFGIIVFVKAFERLEPEEDRPILRALFRMSAGSVGVFVVTLPIVVQSYHEVPVYGVFANVLLLPMLSFLLGGGLLAAVVAAVPGGGEFLFGGVFFGAKLYQVVT
nr:ComEC family competence protein [Eubacterium sp.]